MPEDQQLTEFELGVVKTAAELRNPEAWTFICQTVASKGYPYGNEPKRLWAAMKAIRKANRAAKADAE